MTNRLGEGKRPSTPERRGARRLDRRGRVLLGCLVVGALVLGLAVLGSPGPRSRCESSVATACGPGSSGVATYTGTVLWGSCDVTCGKDSNRARLARAWR